MDKFPSARVVLPDTLAVALCIEKNMNTVRRNFFVCGHKDELRFPEFTLETYTGKHTVFLGDDPFLSFVKEKDYHNEYEDPLKAIFDASGGVDLRNYRITTKEGMSILIWAGQIQEDFRLFLYHDMKPDVMFVQIAATNIGGDRNNPDGSIIGGFAKNVGPKIVLPIHQEKYSPECLASIQKQCNKYFAEEKCNICYENPKPYTWFEIEKDFDGNISFKNQ